MTTPAHAPRTYRFKLTDANGALLCTYEARTGRNGLKRLRATIAANYAEVPAHLRHEIALPVRLSRPVTL